MCVMYVWLCLHICDPPHSLHLPFSRLWWQMPEPLHTLHWLSEAFFALNPAAVMLTQCALGCMRVRVCLYVMYVWLCSHIFDPVHSFHVLLTRLWGQMPAPPHTLH